MSGVLSSVSVAGFMEPEGGGISILTPSCVRIVSAQDATDSRCEIRKAFPMLAIAFCRLLWTDERLRCTYNVVETIWPHATDQRMGSRTVKAH
jgi:hypothetical protein